MPSNNHYRPQRSLYNSITTRLLTPTNFAWFLAGVLVIIMLVLLIKSVSVSGGGKSHPFQLNAITGAVLSKNLRDTRAMGSLVFLYDSACNNCPKQFDSFVNLRSNQDKNEVVLYFINMDDNPEKTVAFLRQQRAPESMITYYAAPDTRRSIASVLENNGAGKITFEFPHSMLFDNEGKLVVEYKGYVRSQEIIRTLRLTKLKNSVMK